MIEKLTRVNVSRYTIHDPMVRNLISQGWRFKVIRGEVYLERPR